MVTQDTRSLLAGAFHPLTDGAFADAECCGNLALGPPPLLEAPGLAPSSFFPLGRCRVHAWESTTKALRL
jgi:hypothetical protein